MEGGDRIVNGLASMCRNRWKEVTEFLASMCRNRWEEVTESMGGGDRIVNGFRQKPFLNRIQIWPGAVHSVDGCDRDTFKFQDMAKLYGGGSVGSGCLEIGGTCHGC